MLELERRRRVARGDAHNGPWRFGTRFLGRPGCGSGRTISWSRRRARRHLRTSERRPPTATWSASAPRSGSATSASTTRSSRSNRSLRGRPGRRLTPPPPRLDQDLVAVAVGPDRRELRAPPAGDGPEAGHGRAPAKGNTAADPSRARRSGRSLGNSTRSARSDPVARPAARRPCAGAPRRGRPGSPARASTRRSASSSTWRSRVGTRRAASRHRTSCGSSCAISPRRYAAMSRCRSVSCSRSHRWRSRAAPSSMSNSPASSQSLGGRKPHRSDDLTGTREARASGPLRDCDGRRGQAPRTIGGASEVALAPARRRLVTVP